MKIYRPLVVLLAFLCGLVASAQDSSEFTSLRAKAVKGNGIAQYNLGLAYVQGKGTAADRIEGFVWLSLARENGARGRDLDNLVSSFDRATYEAAQKRLAQRKVELGYKPAAVTSTPAPATVEAAVTPDTKPAPDAVVPATIQPAATSEAPALARLRAERETLTAQVADLTGNVTALRAERERLIKLSSDHEKTAREATEAGRAAQEQARATEVRVGELSRTNETVGAELERTRQALAALQAAPKPAADTSALDQKNRALQATVAELEAARNFGSQVESTLNKVTSQKTALESQLASVSNEANRSRQETAALAKARDEAQQQLNAVAAEHTVLQAEVAQLRQRPAAPAYPDLSGRVRELEAQVSSLASEAGRAQQEIATLAQAKEDTQRQLAAKPAAPGYPDLSARVSELEGQLAKARQPAAPRYPDLSGRVRELESSLADTQRQLAAKPAAPKYPDLSDRVRELESSLADLSAEAARAQQEIATLAQAKEDAQRQLAAKPAAPAYPDLRSNVAALETELTAAKQSLAARSKPSPPAYPDLSGRVQELEKQLTAVSAETSQSKQAYQAEVQLLGQKLKQSEAATQQAKESLAALQAAPKPAADTSALDQKNRELQAALAELEASRNFGRQVEDTLNKVNDEKARAAAAAAAELEAARNFGQQVESTLNRVTDQKTALDGQLANANSEVNRVRQETAALAKARDETQQELNAIAAEHTVLQSEVAQLRRRPAAPSYPDLSGRVAELETALLAARQPAAPDLTGKVSELETALAVTNRQLIAAQNAAAKATAPHYPDLSAKVGELEATLAATTQKAGATEQARTELSKQFDDYKSSTIAAQRERTTMVAQVKMLESDKAALRRQVDAATAESGQLRTQVAGLKMQQVSIKPAAPAYPDLSGKVGELEAQVNNLTATLAAKPTAPTYPDLSGRVRELETQVSSLASEATRAKQEVVTLSQAKEADSSAIASAKTEAARAKQEIAMLTQAKEDFQRQLAARPVAPVYPDLSSRVSELEGQLARSRQPAAPKYPDLSGRVSELESQLAQARQPAAPQYPDLSGRVRELEAQVSSLASEAGRAQQEMAALTKAKEADLSSVASAQEEATRAKQEAAALAQAKADAQTQIASLTAERDSARSTQTELRDTITKLAQEKAQLAAVSNAAPAYPDLSAKVSELETKLAQAEKSAAEKPAGPAYPDLSGRVTELTSEVAQLRSDRERMQKMLADAGRQLRDNTAAANRIKELETQVASLQGSLTARTDTPDLWGKVVELETKLAAAEKSAATKTAAPAYPDLSGRVRELETTAADSARQLLAAEAAQTGLKQQLAEAGSALQNAAKEGDDSVKLRRERDELSGRITELAGEVAQLRTDRERMQKMLADAGRQLRDNTADTARIKDLETQLTATQTQAGGLTSERDAARSTQNELRGTIARLEQEKSQLGTQPAQLPAPAYPDLSSRVRELEAQVAALANAPRGRAPAYPDLSGRVSELESALAEARQRPAAAPTSSAPAATGEDSSELQKKLTDTEDRLATSLRGYAMLERERDELAAKASRTTEAVAAERNALATQVNTLSGEVAQLRTSAQNSAGSTQTEIARLNEAFTALQRSTAQNSTDLAATRALAQQLQGANAVLAGENYQLKTMLSRTVTPSGPAAVTAAVPAARTHVVASGDSLSRISQRYYGTANRWQEIFNANTDRIAANGLLRIGTELRIP